MKKIVKRTYYSKKLGRNVTKVYTYDYKKRRSGKNLLLVGKNGNEYTDRINDLLSSITDPALKADIKAIVRQSKIDKEKLSMRTLQSKLTTDKYEKMLINAGYSIPEFEKEYGITFSEFSNPVNWKQDAAGHWEFSTGTATYQYQFRYEGSILV